MQCYSVVAIVWFVLTLVAAAVVIYMARRYLHGAVRSDHGHTNDAARSPEPIDRALHAEMGGEREPYADARPVAISAVAAHAAQSSPPSPSPSPQLPVWVWHDDGLDASLRGAPGPPPLANASSKRALGVLHLARESRETHLAAASVKHVSVYNWREWLPANHSANHSANDHHVSACGSDQRRHGNATYARARAQYALLAAHGGIWMRSTTVVTNDLCAFMSELPFDLVGAGTRMCNTASTGYTSCVDDACVYCCPRAEEARAAMARMSEWLESMDGHRAASLRQCDVARRLGRCMQPIVSRVRWLDGAFNGTKDRCGRDVDPCDAKVALAHEPFDCCPDVEKLLWLDLHGLGSHRPGQSWALDVDVARLTRRPFWISGVARLATGGGSAAARPNVVGAAGHGHRPCNP